jgi:hypothetical protein
MTAHPVLEPLITAGLTAAVRPDGRLAVSPSERITPAVDAHIRAHRAELIAVLAVPTQPQEPLDRPPPEPARSEPAWFAAWMREDDARRIATMAAAMQHKADSKRAHPRGNP